MIKKIIYGILLVIIVSLSAICVKKLANKDKNIKKYYSSKNDRKVENCIEVVDGLNNKFTVTVYGCQIVDDSDIKSCSYDEEYFYSGEIPQYPMYEEEIDIEGLCLKNEEFKKYYRDPDSYGFERAEKLFTDNKELVDAYKIEKKLSSKYIFIDALIEADCKDDTNVGEMDCVLVFKSNNHIVLGNIEYFDKAVNISGDDRWQRFFYTKIPEEGLRCTLGFRVDIHNQEISEEDEFDCYIGYIGVDETEPEQDAIDNGRLVRIYL